jgi:prevent-host-death family protein
MTSSVLLYFENILLSPAGKRYRSGYFIVMNKVNVATLKEKLSSYLKLVSRGEEIVVTSYRQPVARIVPPFSRNREVRQPIRRVSELRNIKGIKRKLPVSALIRSWKTGENDDRLSRYMGGPAAFSFMRRIRLRSGVNGKRPIAAICSEQRR